ncbi:hypothetical protein SCHPADRAFT_1002402 [Schizopora paradoxa]|uniref:Uncharacterized protein n=1 Tax=Schizopora paradoxa TaxID=27342 RepID=A0A0H2RNA1_9AGAM|nr:hypothetical protein SCHPADRAFT_1002402 [Schizopora paradoxa]
MASAPVFRYDVDAKTVLDALESMASKQVQLGKSYGIGGGGGLNLEPDSWRRLRTNWHWSDISAEDISQLFHDGKVLGNVIQILEELYSSAIRLHQSIASRSRPTILKLSKGIASLPNEVLMLIFGFAAHPGGRNSWRQAIWLSHVSRRFRNVALGTQSIWTTLDGCASRRGIETFLARSGKNSDLHIILDASLKNDDLHYFVYMCLPLASRWATLLVTSGVDESSCDTADGPFEELFECRGEDELSFPRLQLLRVNQFQSVANSGFGPSKDLKFEPRWTFASLQRIECNEFIPLPSSAYTSVKCLSASLSLPITNFACRFSMDLRNLLPTLQSLTVLDLTIRTSTQIRDTRDFFSIECPSVTSFTLDLPSFTFPGAMDAFLDPFLVSLEFPRLTQFTVSAELSPQDIEDEEDAERHLESLIQSFYLASFVHSNLTTVTIKLSYSEDKTDQKRSDIRPRLLKIPVDEIPDVASLTVQTFTDIEFHTRNRMDENLKNFALRELRLLKCNEIDVTSLEELVTSLRKANVWDGLVDFKMENCGHSLEYEDVARIVGKEKLSFSKSRTS